MSQLTALPRQAARAARTTRRPATTPQRPALRVVQHQDAAEQSGAGFVLLCVVLMVGGLLALLVLNTGRAQQSFAINKLQSRSGNLTDQQQALSSQLDGLAAPQQLALRAQQLGLVPAQQIKYVRQSDDKVLGVAKVSGASQPFTVGTLPTTPASRAADATAAAAKLGLVITKPKPETKDSKAAAGSDPKTSATPSAKASAKPSATTRPSASAKPKPTTSPRATKPTASKPAPKPTATR